MRKADLAMLTKQYGAIIGVKNLRHLLGFESASTFERTVRQNRLGLTLFKWPGRRGRFALTADVAALLDSMYQRSEMQQKEVQKK